MNDDILAHHFDEVFSTLQDKDNFEIFTKIKPARAPLVKKTLFKIVKPGDEQSQVWDEDSTSLGHRTSSRTSRAQYDSTVRSHDSRPSSATSKQRPKVSESGLKYSAGRSVKKLEERHALKDKLGACTYCGRYFVGEFLNVHEKQCDKNGLLF